MLGEWGIESMVVNSVNEVEAVVESNRTVGQWDISSRKWSETNQRKRDHRTAPRMHVAQPPQIDATRNLAAVL